MITDEIEESKPLIKVQTSNLSSAITNWLETWPCSVSYSVITKTTNKFHTYTFHYVKMKYVWHKRLSDPFINAWILMAQGVNVVPINKCFIWYLLDCYRLILWIYRRTNQGPLTKTASIRVRSTHNKLILSQRKLFTIKRPIYLSVWHSVHNFNSHA